MMGSTLVTKAYISLTPNLQGQQGAMWNNARCISSNWEVHIQFKVHGATRSWFGDGMAFWYTQERMETGPVFGNQDYFTGLGVFLDTYVNHDEPHNHQHPYISAMVNNGTQSYDHDKDGTHNQIAGCEAQFRNKNYDTYMAVRYEGNTLTVLLDITNKKEWQECFSVEGVKLPAGYFFGLSAATGDVTDQHDVLFFKFYELSTNKDVPHYEGLPEAPLPKPPHVKEEEDKKKKEVDMFWDIVVSVLMIVGTLCVFAVILFCILHKNRLDTKKKYY
ncbi:VIP36-like protein [Babylonia areolata]|uniref:VIP36-like protein n=1 Tax=Babylonia areolata TaxID=304850 RepID=UPI003FCFD8FB